RRLVARKPAFLRRLAAGADMGLLASCPPHLPSPDTGADVAKACRARAGSGDLRSLRRCEMGRGRPDLLGRGGQAGWMIDPVLWNCQRTRLTPSDNCIYNYRHGQEAARSWTKPRPTLTPSPGRASPCACAC